jgi:hypothetical protein
VSTFRATPRALEPWQSKYAPLRAYLSDQSSPVVVMSFAQIERVIGSPMAASAWNTRQWWANTSGSHDHARAWLDVGRRTRSVNFNSQTVEFYV